MSNYLSVCVFYVGVWVVRRVLCPTVVVGIWWGWAQRSQCGRTKECRIQWSMAYEGGARTSPGGVYPEGRVGGLGFHLGG